MPTPDPKSHLLPLAHLRIVIAGVAAVVVLFWAWAFFNADGDSGTPRSPASSSQAPASGSLATARAGFQTRLTSQHVAHEPPDVPPKSKYLLVNYPSAVGPLASYLSPDPQDARRHPAVIWITGGDCNTIGDVWSVDRSGQPQETDAFRDAGIVMLFPSLRGGNTNPGFQESFFGEVDDIISARQYLSGIPYVDQSRVYLAGHSTGGTLVLLTSECTNQFRAVFAFGPVSRASDYQGGPNPLRFDPYNNKEASLRSPIDWLNSITSPTFVIEGNFQHQGNAQSLREMAATSPSSPVSFVESPSYNHFTILRPACRVLAQKISQDTGSSCSISLSAAELR